MNEVFVQCESGALLFQPGGFEGPIAVGIHLASHGFSVPKRPEMCGLYVELDSARVPAASNANERHDLVPPVK